MTTLELDPTDMAELIDLFFACTNAPATTEAHRRLGLAFNDKLEACFERPDVDEMRAFAREVSTVRSIPYTRAFVDLVQLRALRA